MSYIFLLPIFNLFLGFALSFAILLFPVPAYSQVKLTIPPEFASLPVNARALSKEFQFTLDSNTIGTSQNFVLDKTGFILHLVPSPKIKDENTKLRVFLNDGTEIKLYNFIDNTLFALVSPDETYSIYQEVVPNCQDLTSAFSLDSSLTICPSSELFKLYERIMITEDTSFKINLRNPTDSYLLSLTLPENTELIQADNFNNVNIVQGNVSDSGVGLSRSPINVASLLSVGELCFVGRKKSASKLTIQSCDQIDNNVNSLISFKKSFSSDSPLSSTPNIVFSFLHGGFKNLSHSYFFEYSESFKSTDEPTEINKTSSQKLFFTNYGSKFNVNLGRIMTLATKVKKNVFTLTNPIEINKKLNDSSIVFPVDKLDPIITLSLNNSSFDVFLSEILLDSVDNLNNTYSISVSNNIVIPNLSEPASDSVTNRRFQSTSTDALIISSYLPEEISTLSTGTKYTFVEQFLAPSVDDNGEPIDVINNKSKADLLISKDFSNIDLLTFRAQSGAIILDIDSASNVLNNKSFTKQGNFSGFLIPPDLRPVIQSDYRATVSVNMTISLVNDETLKILYSDLKTKDEPDLTNFFNFSHLPLGKYDVKLEFDADRTKFFQTAGVVPVEE